MRRALAFVLMLLLPLQSVWALVATPCTGMAWVPPGVVAAAVAATQDDHAAHHAPALEAAALAGGHAHHGAHDGGSDGSPGDDAHYLHHQDDASGAADGGCSGSAACMSLHSPPLAHAPGLGLPSPERPALRHDASAPTFSSAPAARLHKPPIGRPA